MAINYSERQNRAVLEERRAKDCAAFLIPFLRGNERLLDCGCGPGKIAVELAGLLPDGEVVGVDADPKQIQRARKIVRDRKCKNAHFLIEDACGLSFEDDSFDVVFAHALLYHLKEPEHALSEFRRVLKAGGRVAVRDSDLGGNVFAPSNSILEEAFEIDLVDHETSPSVG